MPLSRYDKYLDDELKIALNDLIGELDPTISLKPDGKKESLRVFQFKRIKNIGKVLDVFQRRQMPLDDYIEWCREQVSTSYEVYNSFKDNKVNVIDLLSMFERRNVPLAKHKERSYISGNQTVSSPLLTSYTKACSGSRSEAEASSDTTEHPNMRRHSDMTDNGHAAKRVKRAATQPKQS